MKKVGIVVAIAMIGATIAVASSLAVPWFADGAPKAAGFPPTQELGGTTTLIYLKNNDLAEDIVCEITYFSADGDDLGPAYPDNTFIIPAGASVAFRPAVVDPSPASGHPDAAPGGQESAVGAEIPIRPQDVDPRTNGSAIVQWTGGPADVQGMVVTAGFGKGGAMSYAHLLPPGN